VPDSSRPRPNTAQDALRELRAGNARFVADVTADNPLGHARRAQLVASQEPFAIVLSCSDSRAPAELVFDCGLGDLFVVRVAGNVCAPSLVGSVEFAAATFDTQLVVVMGHTNCGAIKATLDVMNKKREAPLSTNFLDIVGRIMPSVAEVFRPDLDGKAMTEAATRANIRATVRQLGHGSRLIEDRISKGSLLVVGAEYDLATGQVDFFHVPE
jgi:carbonic anhydrase